MHMQVGADRGEWSCGWQYFPLLGQPLPRLVSVADNRDFFYLLRRNAR